MVSVKELRRQIETEKNKVMKERKQSEKKLHKKELKQQLFLLKHRKGIRFSQTIVRGARKVGKGVTKVAEKFEKSQKKRPKKSGSGGVMDMVNNL